MCIYARLFKNIYGIIKDKYKNVKIQWHLGNIYFYVNVLRRRVIFHDTTTFGLSPRDLSY